MPVQVTIRKADQADTQLLAELGARTYADTFATGNTAEDMAAYLTGAFSPEIQSAELAEPGSMFLIAELDGRPVGYTRLRQDPPPDCITGRHPIEIVRLYSVKDMIGHGIGAALMAACLEEARRRECDVIWLDVWEKNPRAIAFYERWGFVKVGEQDYQLGNDLQHDWLMARNVMA